MKRFLILATILLGVLGISHTAQANDFKPYVGAGIGVSAIKVSISGAGSQSGGALGGFGCIGFDYGKFFGGELRIGTTGSASVTINRINYSTSIDWFTSYLAKVKLPLSKHLTIYSLVGATTVKQTTKINTPGWLFIPTGTNKYSTTTTDASVGFGLDYRTRRQWHFATELMSYNGNFATLTINLNHSY